MNSLRRHRDIEQVRPQQMLGNPYPLLKIDSSFRRDLANRVFPAAPHRRRDARLNGGFIDFEVVGFTPGFKCCAHAS